MGAPPRYTQSDCDRPACVPRIATAEDALFRELIAKGHEQGECSLLERQLARRFGPLPTWARDKLAAAHADLLEQWADRTLDAATLEEALQD